MNVDCAPKETMVFNMFLYVYHKGDQICSINDHWINIKSSSMLVYQGVDYI